MHHSIDESQDRYEYSSSPATHVVHSSRTRRKKKPKARSKRVVPMVPVADALPEGSQLNPLASDYPEHPPPFNPPPSPTPSYSTASSVNLQPFAVQSMEKDPIFDQTPAPSPTPSSTAPLNPINAFSEEDEGDSTPPSRFSLWGLKWYIWIPSALLLLGFFFALFFPLILIYPQLDALHLAQNQLTVAQNASCYFVQGVQNTSLLDDLTGFLDVMSQRLVTMEDRLTQLENAQGANQTQQLKESILLQMAELKTELESQVQESMALALQNQSSPSVQGNLTESMNLVRATMRQEELLTRINITQNTALLLGAQLAMLTHEANATQTHIRVLLLGLQNDLATHELAILQAQNHTAQQVAANWTRSMDRLESLVGSLHEVTRVNLTQGIGALLGEQTHAIRGDLNDTQRVLSQRIAELSAVLAQQTERLRLTGVEQNASLVQMGTDLTSRIAGLHALVTLTEQHTQANVTAELLTLALKHKTALMDASNATRDALSAQIARVHQSVLDQTSLLNQSMSRTAHHVNTTSLESLLIQQRAELDRTIQGKRVNLTTIHIQLVQQHSELLGLLTYESNLTRANVTHMRDTLSAQHGEMMAGMRAEAEMTRGNLTGLHGAVEALRDQVGRRPDINGSLHEVLHRTADVQQRAFDLKYQIDALDPYAPQAWGSNAYHTLHPNKTSHPALPLPASFTHHPYTSLFRTTRFAAFSLGGQHALALTPQGDVFSWGSPSDTYGRRGVPASTASVGPFLLAIPERVVDVAAGQDHSLFLTENGRVYACGRNDESGRVTSSHNTELIPAFAAGGVAKIYAGQRTSYAIKSGLASSWGDNAYGRLGHGVSTSTPTSFLGSTVTQLAVGPQHCFALVSSGALYAWGRAANGRLGLGPAVTADQNTPQQIPQARFGHQPVMSIATGANTAYALVQGLTNGYYTWGSNANWQMGTAAHPTVQEWPLLQTPAIFTNETLVTMAGGEGYALVKTQGGDLYSAGNPTNGRLGRVVASSLRELWGKVDTLVPGEWSELCAAHASVMVW